jgi:nucleoredoxin
MATALTKHRTGRPWLGWLLGWIVLAGLVDSSNALPLPAEISVIRTTKLELIRDEKISGSLELSAGERLTVTDLKDQYVLVRYRNLNARVLAADTNLAKLLPPSATPVPIAAPPSPAVTALSAQAAVAVKTEGAPSAAPANSAIAPPTRMAALLTGKLVILEGGALRPLPAARLGGVKFFAFYFSAGWCPPCQQFTPEFVDAYGKLRSVFPELEVVMVSRDRSPAAMFEYMRDDHQSWPALRWDQIRGAAEINHYAGAGIPCLVLVDADGKVLSDSYRWTGYVGPDAVLDDTWKILRDYRRKNPRQKS